jgi:outer membrane protein OmpA-like peptidoglycan-associated protein
MKILLAIISILFFATNLQAQAKIKKAEPIQASPAPQQVISDKDKDGVPDHLDSCINEPGIASLNGCPDFDGDGIPDYQDACPKKAGTPKLKGCPDRDNDGIPDDLDDCPDAFGFPALNGCMDLDGDQIPDSKDGCPNRAGPISNKGCPEMNKEIQQLVKEAQDAIQFKTGGTQLLPSSEVFLLKLVQTIQKNQELKFEIYCQTKELKTEKLNQDLAINRAATIEKFLIDKGVYSKRVSFKSFSKTDKSMPKSGNIHAKTQTLIVPLFINP